MNSKIEKLKRLVTVYWLPISASMVFQGLAFRYVAEARGEIGFGGELLALPMMYMVYVTMRALPIFIEEVRNVYGYER